MSFHSSRMAGSAYLASTNGGIKYEKKWSNSINHYLRHKNNKIGNKWTKQLSQMHKQVCIDP